MPTLVESKCCKEYSELLRDKLDGVKCIYNHRNTYSLYFYDITQENDFAAIYA